MKCEYCDKPLKKEHYLECTEAHKYYCHKKCSKEIIKSIIKNDLTFDTKPLDCKIDNCKSFYYTINLRSLKTILVKDMSNKRYNKTFGVDDIATEEINQFMEQQKTALFEELMIDDFEHVRSQNGNLV